MIERTCSIEGCTRKVVARGWCMTHYSRWRVHGDPGPAELLLFRNTEATCVVGGCAEPSKRQNMCMAHLLRYQRHGDPLAGGPKQDHRPLANRYLERTRRDANGCLLWTGAKSGSGYPHAGAGGQIVSLHRWVYETFVTVVPAGWEVDHRCHNDDPTCSGGVDCLHRLCLERTHLEAVPRGLNIVRARLRCNVSVLAYQS